MQIRLAPSIIIQFYHDTVTDAKKRKHVTETVSVSFALGQLLHLSLRVNYVRGVIQRVSMSSID